MHIYYKYFFQLREQKIKRLSAPVDWNGTVIEKDISLIYYPLRDIEKIRKQLEALGHDVTMSICFDLPSKRLEGDTEAAAGYKSGRQQTLNDEDFQNVEFISKMIKDAGHNSYRIEGYEADDIVNHLCRNFSGDFDYTIVYTNDKDILVNINDKVGVMRFKQTKGYTQVDKNNYENYLEGEFGVFIPYNSLGLFLSTAGDSADRIKGINKFGKVAFSKLITRMSAENEIDWSSCGDYDKLAEVVSLCEKYLTPDQFKQLTESFALVANIELIDEIEPPTNKSTQELREKAYGEYKMISLIP